LPDSDIDGIPNQPGESVLDIEQVMFRFQGTLLDADLISEEHTDRNVAENVLIVVSTCLGIITLHESSYQFHRRHQRKKRRHREQHVEKLRQTLEDVSPITQMALLELIMTVAGASDVARTKTKVPYSLIYPDQRPSDWFDYKSGTMEPSRDNAHQIAQRFLLRLTESSTVGEAFPELKQKIIDVFSLLNQSGIRIEKRSIYVWNVLQAHFLPATRSDVDGRKILHGLQMVRTQLGSLDVNGSGHTEQVTKRLADAQMLLDDLINYLS
jgi:hypothetical protein